jgi:DNA-directed RNA polymerase subunit beta
MADMFGRKSYSRISDVLTLPSLIEVQLESFDWFRQEGLAELFEEVSPIESFNGGMQLWFPSRRVDPQFGLKYWFEDPKYDIDECVERDLTFAAPLYVKVLLSGTEVPHPVVNDIFLGDFPLMTENGTFIINGTERVVVSQLIRSPGVYFEAEEDRASGRNLARVGHPQRQRRRNPEPVRGRG